MIDLNKYYVEIKNAYNILKNVVYNTPIDYSNTFSNICSGKVYLKLENLQRTGSFKVRGAYYKISTLDDDLKRKGVVTASSGNHAQGVAYSASANGVESIIVMPELTPASKILATKSYGAKVIIYGRIYDEAYNKAIEICDETGFTFIHPFDDPKIIAGQGTIAIEIIKQLKQFDVIIIPVGGGGLISGISIVIRKLLGNKVKIFGVEPKLAPKFKVSLNAGRPVNVEISPSLADGLLAKRPGNTTYKIVSELVDDIILVDEENIARAMFLMLERGKLLVEGAGAAPLAALLSQTYNFNGKRIVAVISGGNVDLSTIYKIILRGLSLERRIARYKVIMEDVPGALKEALKIIAMHRGNIIDIKHDRLDPKIDHGYATVELIVELHDPETEKKIKDGIKALGYKIKTIK